MKTLDVLKTYTPVQFLRLVHTSKGRWNFNSQVHVNMDKDRYREFLQKGLTCSHCGRKATQVRLEVQTRQPNIGSFEPYSDDNVRIQYHHYRKRVLCTDCNYKIDKGEI